MRRVRRRMDAASPLRAGAAMRRGVCRACGVAGTGVVCCACAPGVLGTSGTGGDGALRDVCATPTIESLLRLLVDTDVCGDGSCWSYAVLAALGQLEHVLDERGRLSGAVGEVVERDRMRDALLRAAVAQWMTDNDGVRRFCGGAAAADLEGDPVARVRSALPAYRSDGWLWPRGAGSYGGDQEFVALADLVGCVIFSFASGDSGDVRGTRYEPGMVNARQRGRWVASTLSATVEHCVLARSRLLCMRRFGRHWHALLPRDEHMRTCAWRAPPFLLAPSATSLSAARAAVRAVDEAARRDATA